MMKLMLNFLRTKKGFTLIELLIVIALLGALAVGLLATVDPFEQLKKGNDTSTRNTAAELYNAYIRYYAQRSAFPSLATAAIPFTGLPADSAAITGSITDMASAGELKANFIELAGTSRLHSILVTMPSGGQSVIVCVQPQSKAFRNDANTIYNSDGTTAATGSCPSPTSTSCFVCFQ